MILGMTKNREEFQKQTMNYLRTDRKSVPGFVDKRKCRVISQKGKFTNVMLMYTIAITVEPPLLSYTMYIFFPIHIRTFVCEEFRLTLLS